MKNSIAYLPNDKQEDLNFLVKEILKRLPQTEFIILYGSYARDNYVRRGIRVEHGIPTVKISDYDVLVITSGVNNGKAETTLDNVEDLFFATKDFDRDTPVQFINDDIRVFNKAIEEGRYFYTQIKQEGVVLYDSGKFKLARRRKLNFEEIKQQAQEYFDEKFDRANGFLQATKLIYDNMKDYKLCSFNLHQACENYYYAIRLTHTLRNNKQHNLSKLSGSTKRYSDDLRTVFPQSTPEEKRLFALLKAAYVDARYNPKFIVTKEDIDELIPKVELLQDITKRICEGRIMEYGEKE